MYIPGRASIELFPTTWLLATKHSIDHQSAEHHQTRYKYIIIYNHQHEWFNKVRYECHLTPFAQMANGFSNGLLVARLTNTLLYVTLQLATCNSSWLLPVALIGAEITLLNTKTWWILHSMMRTDPYNQMLCHVGNGKSYNNNNRTWICIHRTLRRRRCLIQPLVKTVAIASFPSVLVWS